MAKAIPGYLKLQGTRAAEAERSEAEHFNGLAELCYAFSDATGWPLRYESGAELRQDPVLKWSAPVDPGVGAALGHLRIDLGDSDDEPVARRREAKPAQRLAAGIADLLGQLAAARRTVWHREADLAAGVPVIERPDEPRQLATRLRAVLKAGAKACDCDAAALYMLDEGTSELKLRSAWGLPVERLMQPARPLDGALADLEALLGHAVALERAASFGPWHVPEEFPAALCVPVSTQTLPLGTLWLFSDRERDFSSTQTDLAEMTAGRLAAELERAMLITAQMESLDALRQIDAARRLQQSQLPQPIRLVEEGWELAGRSLAAGQVSGAFYDWYWLPGDALAIAVGEAGQTGIAGALTAAALRAAIRTHVEQGLAPGELIERINRSLWFTAGGDESATLLCGIVELPTGRLRYAWAGQPNAIWHSNTVSKIALAARPPLGVTTEIHFAEQSLEFAPGEVLVLSSRGIGNGSSNPGEKTVLKSPTELLESFADRDREASPVKQDRAMLAIKRMSRSGFPA